MSQSTVQYPRVTHTNKGPAKMKDITLPGATSLQVKKRGS